MHIFTHLTTICKLTLIVKELMFDLLTGENDHKYNLTLGKEVNIEPQHEKTSRRGSRPVPTESKKRAIDA